jgi:hypothetical protein
MNQLFFFTNKCIAIKLSYKNKQTMTQLIARYVALLLNTVNLHIKCNFAIQIALNALTLYTNGCKPTKKIIAKK